MLAVIIMLLGTLPQAPVQADPPKVPFATAARRPIPPDPGGHSYPRLLKVTKAEYDTAYEKAFCGKVDKKNKLVMHHIYVGQGSSTFIKTPEGKSILVDGGITGPDLTILPVLQKCYGVTDLDFVILTHPHEDHYQGLPDTLLNFPPNTVFIPTEFEEKRNYALKPYNPNGDNWDKIYTDLKNNFLTVVPPLGTGTISDKDVKFNFLTVDGKVAAGERVEIYKPNNFLIDANAASIGFMIEYNNFKYWLGGDLSGGGKGAETPPVEQALAKAVKTLGPIDVYVSHHHGSCTANSDDWMEAIQPRTIIISVGLGKTNGDRAVLLEWMAQAANAKADGTVVPREPHGFHLPNKLAIDRMLDITNRDFPMKPGAPPRFTQIQQQAQANVGQGPKSRVQQIIQTSAGEGDITPDGKHPYEALKDGGGDVIVTTDGTSYVIETLNIASDAIVAGK